MSETTPLIILVDDDTDYLEINRHIMESAGYRVRTFLDPQDALESMKEERGSLVITDLMMKTLDSGFSFSCQVKERFGNIPVIIMTAVGSRRGFDFKPRNEQDLAAMHVDAFFDKSTDSETLLSEVKELLGRTEAQR